MTYGIAKTERKKNREWVAGVGGVSVPTVIKNMGSEVKLPKFEAQFIHCHLCGFAQTTSLSQTSLSHRAVGAHLGKSFQCRVSFQSQGRHLELTSVSYYSSSSSLNSPVSR